MKRQHANRRSEGQGLVEFALALPFLMVMLLVLVNVGRSIFAFNTVSEVARSAARVAIVDQNLSDIQAVVNDPRAAWLGIPAGNVNPSYSCGTTYAIGCIVTVTVTYPLNPFFFAEPNVKVSVPAIGLSSSSAMPIERVSP